jgi:LPS export ABC transporter protein LptC
MKRIAFLAWFLLLLGCPPEKKELPGGEEPPSTVINNFSLVETNQARKMWVLSASRALVYQSKERVVVETLMIDFFNAQGEKASHLVAPAGELHTKTRNMSARGGVLVRTQDSSILHTDSLFWQNDSSRIITMARVLIERKDKTRIEGMGLVTDPELKKIVILGRISGESSVEIKK